MTSFPADVTQDQYKIDVVKRLGKDVELNAWMQDGTLEGADLHSEGRTTVRTSTT